MNPNKQASLKCPQFMTLSFFSFFELSHFSMTLHSSSNLVVNTHWFLLCFLRFFFNWCGTIFLSLYWICYNIIYVLVLWPWGMWDLSCWSRDWTSTLCMGRPSLNHWTAREVPTFPFWLNKQMDQKPQWNSKGLQLHICPPHLHQGLFIIPSALSRGCFLCDCTW